MDKKHADAILQNLIAAMPIFHRKLFNALDEGLGPGLSHQHFAILAVLKPKAPLPVSAICRRLLISKSQMTAMLDRLAVQGLVSRMPDEKDRRVVRISLTPAGKKVLNGALTSIRKKIAQNMATLEKDDVELFSASLENIVDVGSRWK